MQPIQNTRTRDELASTLTVRDFVAAWSRVSIPFGIGLILVIAAAFIWAKTQTPYYHARASFFVTSIDGPGQSDSIRGWQNEEVHAAFLTNLAEQYLISGDFLKKVSTRMQEPADPGLLGSGLKVRDIQKSGIIIIEAELPSPGAAADFLNVCLEVLHDELFRNASSKVTVIDHATPPAAPSRPKMGLAIGLSAALYIFVFMVGLILGAPFSRRAHN